jgi:hypothetical protein
MAVTVKVEPIDRDIELMLSDMLSPQAQSNALAEFAIASLKDVEAENNSVSGSQLDYLTFVDGVEGADEFSVQPDGTIVYEFQLVSEVLSFISQQLDMNSPVGSGYDSHPGLYKSSHVVFADGIEVATGVNIPVAQQYTFVNTLPYSIKIEKGESSQAPNGVYEVTANQASSKYGNIAKIAFIDYVGVFGVMAEASSATYGRKTRLQHNKSVNRFPAISVSLK